MALTKKEYKPRLIDEKVSKYLKIFGAINIVGPKWCGKTWTALNHAKSMVDITEKENKDLALINPKYIFKEDKPQLIDEWQIVPEIWDSVRHACDEDNKKGKFILTGSTTLNKEENAKVFHSGAGRICKLNMYTMSLYESKDSSGEVSITDMLNDTVNCKRVAEPDLEKLAMLIVRGGWPANINTDVDNVGIIPKSYIESVLDKDISEQNKTRDKRKMLMLLRALARNESTLASENTILKDINEYESSDDYIKSRTTLIDYLECLDRLQLIENQEPFSINYRSSKKIGKTCKRRFVDPSLACACLNLTAKKLLTDLNTFGLLFESLVIRDLRIYMDYLTGNIYHFRDNSSGDEVDAILEFSDGSYGAVEIKLSSEGIEDAKKSLLTFYKNVEKKPKFMAIILGYYGAIVKDEDTNIFIIPITVLKP